jgi:hypothetical protein
LAGEVGIILFFYHSPFAPEPQAQGNRMNAFGQQNDRFYPLQKAHEGEKGGCRGDF